MSHSRVTMTAMRAAVALLGLLPLAVAAAAQEPEIAIMGRVLGPGGSPLANARVELRPIPSRYEAGLREAKGEDPAPPAARAATGPDGRFALRAPRPGMWRVVVAADGFVPRQHPLIPLLEDTELPPVELATEVRGRFPTARPNGWTPAGEPSPQRSRVPPLSLSGSLAGRVLDRDTCLPLAGAVVWPESDPGCWVRTDAGGAFVLHGIAVPRESGLAAAALGHESGFVSLQPGTPPIFALAASVALTGVVADARGRPLADAAVEVSRLGLEEEEVRFAHTSADGGFRVPGLRAGASYSVSAVLPGFSPVSTAVAIPQPAAPVPALRLVLGRGHTVVGRVADDRGRPVAGARVELRPGINGRVAASEPEVREKAFQRTRTDGDGKFKLPHLPTGWFTLRIEAGGFLPLERAGLRIPAGTSRVDLGRFLLQRGAALQGWAVDDDGKPLAGAEVWIIPAPVRDWAGFYAKGPAAVTRADGSFLVHDLPHEGSFGLDVCRAGYLPLSATVREITEEPFRVVLRRAARISGRVTAAGGAPVPAARIESWLAGEEPAGAESLRPCRRGSGAATADAEGHFQLDGLPPGWWSLRTAADGHLSSMRERLHVLGGESLEGVEIVLGRGAVVSGRVFTSDGEPAAGARVSVFGEAGTVQAVAAGDGAYRLAGVEPGERTVEATLGDGPWASRSFTVVAGDNRLDLTMDQGRRRQEICGRVLAPGGGPVGGAAVLAGGAARTFSAADGSFRLAVEDNHDYDVWAEREGFAAARAAAAVRVEGAPVEGVEIRLGRGAALTGRLLGLEREELAQASVEAELSPPFVARAAVDSQGTYRLEDVPPGEWTVTAHAGERAVSERAVLPADVSAAAVDLAFAPSREVSGWVSGPAGEAVAGAFIRFFAPGGVSGSTYSRPDGSFRLRLEDGTYRVVARREGYLWTLQEEPVAVESGPVSGLELRLDEGAVIRGRVLGLEPGARAKAVWATSGSNGGRREGQLDQEDGFVIPDVPPGDWTVKVLYGGREGTAAVHLDSGQEEWIEVEMGSL